MEQPDSRGCLRRARGRRSAPRISGIGIGRSILASSLAFVDGSVVNVDFRQSAAISMAARRSAVVINLYLLPLSSLLLLGGAVGDRFDAATYSSSASEYCRRLSALCRFLRSRLAAGRAHDAGNWRGFCCPTAWRCLAALIPARRVAARSAFGRLQARSPRRSACPRGWYRSVGWRAIFLVNLPLAAVAIGPRLVRPRSRAQ